MPRLRFGMGSELQTFVTIAGGFLTLGLFVGGMGMAYGRFTAHLTAYSAAMKECRERLNSAEGRLQLLERSVDVVADRTGTGEFDVVPRSSPRNRVRVRPPAPGDEGEP